MKELSYSKLLVSLKLILALALTSPIANASSEQQIMKFNFGNSHCGDCDWFVVLDGVMGGRSSGELKVRGNSLELSGKISLVNRGGFASIRTAYALTDLSVYKGIKIRYRATGQSFAFTLSNYRRFYLPRFKHTLHETGGNWRELVLAFDDFQKMRFSELLGGGPTVQELKKVIRLGLISNDKKASDYTLEIDYIEFVTP